MPERRPPRDIPVLRHPATEKAWYWLEMGEGHWTSLMTQARISKMLRDLDRAMTGRQPTDHGSPQPEVRDLDELWAWMNTWGDLYARHEDREREWKKGYEQAIADLLKRMAEMGVENCSDEAWRRFTGRRSY